MAEFKTGEDTVDEQALRMADDMAAMIEANPDTAKSITDSVADEAAEWLAGAILLGRGYFVIHHGGLLYAAKTKETLNALTRTPDVP